MSVFVAGLLLSWLMQRLGSMRVVMVAHALANTVALAAAYFFAPWLTASRFGNHAKVGPCSNTSTSLRRVRTEGVRKSDRTGTGTLSIFGHQMRFDLADGFPLVTTKKLHVKSHHSRAALVPRRATPTSPTSRPTACASGTNGRRADGELGPVYGRQWRSWATPDGRSIDQISEAVSTLKSNPDSRRIIVLGLEPGRHPRHGAGAVSLPVPVLRRERPPLLPALPALGRCLSRRALQHRELCAAHHDDGAGDRPRSRASSFTPLATLIFIRTISSRPTSSSRASRARCRRCTSTPISFRSSISATRISGSTITTRTLTSPPPSQSDFARGFG